ncbi:glycoside hydrolase family 105 protein [Paenibacillus sp. MBLB4367]|uniref:glycoside hydrolase family 88/105 protein n=1 Tax=Paenibacillus sp. MBLB4367 TaxID=3384767 RepID=UPI00390832E7
MTSIHHILERVAAHSMDSEGELSSQMKAWQWGQGVALYGLTKTYEQLGDPSMLDYVERWLDGHLRQHAPGRSINTTAPVLAALSWMKLQDSAKYRSLCEQFASWCMSDAPRTLEGAYEHSCTENVYPGQIWADTLFMGCIFLAEWGVYTGNQEFVREAARQFVLHYNYLGDNRSGLIYHGYYGNEGKRMGVLWGRGNGWFTAASAVVLPHLRGLPEYEEVLRNYRLHVQGAVERQHLSGAWHTVMDDPATYLESSVTAAFAFGLNIGIEHGWLEKAAYRTPAKKAIQVLNANISAEGQVQHGSGGTCVMPTAAEYNDIPYSASPFTQGLALLALCSEMSQSKGLQQKGSDR